MRIDQAVGRGANCEDRVALLQISDGVIAVLADGAGGTSGGADAAQAVIDGVQRAIDSGLELNARGLKQLLLEFSAELEDRGQTTAVIVVVRKGLIIGASVGDSGAWLVERGVWRELTAGQPRKPLLGGGFAAPHTFECELVDAELMLASDGVINFANGDAVRELLRNDSLTAQACCDAIIDVARLPSGALQDDASVLVVRLRPDAGLVSAIRAGAIVDRRDEWRLELWLASTFRERLGRGTDGVKGVTIETDAEGRTLLTGAIWERESQQLHPFRARVKLGRDRFEELEVELGEEPNVIRSSSQR